MQLLLSRTLHDQLLTITAQSLTSMRLPLTMIDRSSIKGKELQCTDCVAASRLVPLNVLLMSAEVLLKDAVT
jgi:hypothetical protein